MLTLERWRRRSIYSLGGRRGTRASALYCAQTDGAGCPGDGPDVRGFRSGRMSGLGAGCPAAREEPDVRASGRMSGLNRSASGAFCDGRRISGLVPDVRACGRGRMCGSCSLSPVPLVVLLHPCTWGLVHHSEHLREGLLGT